MNIGDLVRLAKWCENGPALMEICGKTPSSTHVKAIFLEGPDTGLITDVHVGNLFSLEDYDEAMDKQSR